MPTWRQSVDRDYVDDTQRDGQKRQSNPGGASEAASDGRQQGTMMRATRAVESLFIVGVLLFVAGLSLVIVGARALRSGTGAVAAAAPERPVASVRQLMAAIVEPASNAVFNAVSTTVTEKGTEEKAPQSAEDWAALGANAAALAEAGELLKADGRAIDRGDWITMAQSMVDAAHLTLKAVDARSAQGVFDAGGELYTSCDNCHRQYQR